MFDPFKDFETAGYLRNTHQVKDAELVKRIEHDLFLANLPDALAFLASRSQITYGDFLEVHRLLFSAFYPWSGCDRSVTAPNIAVSKADTLFAHPKDAHRAVMEGLRLGQLPQRLQQTPGLVMGLFAYGHPFLDGNGRTMLVVHAGLTHRAGFSINWSKTAKVDYLSALSDEIQRPAQGILDAYLLRFKESRVEPETWGKEILSIKGLDGLNADNRVDGEFSSPSVAKKYQAFDQGRGYQAFDQ
jgi:cell filamentation protein